MRSLAAGRCVSLSRSSIVGLLGMAGMLGCGDSQGPSTAGDTRRRPQEKSEPIRWVRSPWPISP
jgi:hypothetical protein